MKVATEDSAATSRSEHYVAYIALLEKFRDAATEEESDAISDKLDFHFEHMSEEEQRLCSKEV